MNRRRWIKEKTGANPDDRQRNGRDETRDFSLEADFPLPEGAEGGGDGPGGQGPVPATGDRDGAAGGGTDEDLSRRIQATRSERIFPRRNALRGSDFQQDLAADARQTSRIKGGREQHPVDDQEQVGRRRLAKMPDGIQEDRFLESLPACVIQRQDVLRIASRLQPREGRALVAGPGRKADGEGFRSFAGGKGGEPDKAVGTGGEVVVRAAAGSDDKAEARAARGELVFLKEFSGDFGEIGKFHGPAEALAALVETGEVTVDEDERTVQAEHGFKKPEAEEGPAVLSGSGVVRGGEPLAVAPDLGHRRDSGGHGWR